MRKRILIYIVSAEVVIIVGIVYSLFINRQQGNVLSVVSVNPTPKDQYELEQIDGLKYFFEPKPNFTNVKDLSWMGEDYHYSVKFSINADRLNQIEDVQPEKPDNEYRIITLGDSFTFGENVNTADNYPSQLQSLLDKNCIKDKKFQVINLGVPGYDILYSVKRLRIRGMKYDPDLVLWLFIKDDFYRFNESQIALSDIYNQKLRDSGNFTSYNKEGIFDIGWQLAENKIIGMMGGKKDALLKQKEYLFELNKYFKKDLVFATFSHESGKFKDLLHEYIQEFPNSYLFDIPNTYNDPTNSLPDGHPNKEGHKVIAQAFFDYLTENKLIPCN